MILAAVLFTLLFAVTLAALVRSVRRERRRVAALEQRLSALEVEAATTIVFEPPAELGASRELLN